MTKKYNVVPVEDYYVAIDETILPKQNDICWGGGDIIEFFRSRWQEKDWKKIVATIGKRIDNLSLIEIPDEKSTWVSQTLMTIQATYSEEIQKQALSNLFDFAQSKGTYTEKDMKKCWSQAITNMVLDIKDNPNNLNVMDFNDLLASLKKPITAVELELLDTPKDLADDFEIGGGDTSYTKWVNTLKIDKNNIIHPVNVFYE